jgi:nanoRNase/pAp phosphatase (c-di-AMP/oligoRNAs hydrolase)
MVQTAENKARRDKLAALLELASRSSQALIVTHNDPDPDAFGAAAGLAELFRRRLQLRSAIAYSGIIGRAENKAMVRELGIDARPLSCISFADYGLLVLVDSQPGAGNQPLGHTRLPDAVIDHHPLRTETLNVPFWDVRNDCSATSTIVTGYLRLARLSPSRATATALFYGIKTDSLGLARSSHDEDTQAYVYLQHRLDREALTRIENASVSPDYFQALDRALHQTTAYDGLVVARIGDMQYPDMAAEVADFLRRLEGARVIVALGRFHGDVVISVRSPDSGAALDELVEKVIRSDGTAGGHGYMAAGRVPASLAGSAAATEDEIVRRFSRALGQDRYTPRPLIS